MDLGLHGEVVGREGVPLDEHLVASRCRSVEAHHQEMQVDGERVHGDHLVLPAAHEGGERSGEEFVVRLPGEVAREVTLHPEGAPSVELGRDVVARRPREGTEGVADEVDAVGQLELVAQGGERVGGVERGGVEGDPIGHSRPAFPGWSAPQLGQVRASRSSSKAWKSGGRSLSMACTWTSTRWTSWEHSKHAHSNPSSSPTGRWYSTTTPIDSIWPLRGVTHTRGEEVDVALADRHVVGGLTGTGPDHEVHVTCDLVEELLAGVVVEVAALVASADDHHDHVGLPPDLSVGDGRSELVTVILDPLGEAEGPAAIGARGVVGHGSSRGVRSAGPIGGGCSELGRRLKRRGEVAESVDEIGELAGIGELLGLKGLRLSGEGGGELGAVRSDRDQPLAAIVGAVLTRRAPRSSRRRSAWVTVGWGLRAALARSTTPTSPLSARTASTRHSELATPYRLRTA